MRGHATGSPAASWESRLIGVITAVLVVFGVAAVYGASSIVAVNQGDPGAAFALRHAIGGVVGFVMLAVAARADYRWWRRMAWPLLVLTGIALLTLLLPFASPVVREINGARRWLGVQGLAIQPAEVAKLAVIIWVSALAAKKGDRIREFKKGLLPFLVVLGPVALMVLLEPALSNAILLCLIAGIILFTAGARIGHFLLLAVVATPFLWQQIVTTQYRFQRMMSFLSQGADGLETGWQIQQSLTGMGAGRLFGVGFGEGMQKLGYLPYAYSDFIFSTIGEEWGFLGVTVLILLYGVFIWAGLRIARRAADPFGQFLGVGITTMIGATAILHIGVTLGVMPTTGLPLPFLSYGRSNLLVSMLATGILLSIGHRSTAAVAKR